MKIFFLLSILFIISSANVQAGKAVVITHEAPLFIEKSLTSEIVQYVRENDIVYIHDKHLEINPEEEIFRKNSGIRSNSTKINPLNDFFLETIDNNGRTAYIPRNYVKLITNEEEEKGVYNRLIENEIKYIKYYYGKIAEFFDKYYDFHIAFKHSYSRIFINLALTFQPVREHKSVIDEIIGLCFPL